MGCTKNCKKWTLVGLFVAFLSIGLFLDIFAIRAFNLILQSQLSLKNPNTKLYSMWKETPIPMYLTVNLFNWTNVDDVVKSNWEIKPEFKECGPYVFHERHSRENIQFNPNNTLTYQTKRTWHFDAEKSKGKLEDPITTLNAVALTIANVYRNQHYLVKKAIDVILKEMGEKVSVTKTATEFMFDGYEDKLLDLAIKLKPKGIKIPFKKFGWFVERNNSASYDGTYVMNTGADSMNKMGRFTEWNGSNRTQNYDSFCSMVNGTSGELWYPPNEDQNIQIFTPDLCSSLTLTHKGQYEEFGVKANKYVMEPYQFDNGSSYPDMKCFQRGLVLPSGVRNISECKFGAPAFVSFPHFAHADPSYLSAIRGVTPNNSTDDFYMSLEPSTGVPWRVQANLQINLYARRIPEIAMFSKIPNIMFPALWFSQTAEINEDISSQIKMLVRVPSFLSYTGYVLIILAVLLAVLGFFIKFKNGWKQNENQELLGEKALA